MQMSCQRDKNSIPTCIVFLIFKGPIALSEWQTLSWGMFGQLNKIITPLSFFRKIWKIIQAI